MKIWRETKEWFEGKFLVVRRDGSVPNWPWFVLGARDPHAARALCYYSAVAQESGVDVEYCESLRRLADSFDAYRMAEGDGNPSAAPHRKDDAAVIRAMRGMDSGINVRRDKGNTKEEEKDSGT